MAWYLAEVARGSFPWYRDCAWQARGYVEASSPQEAVEAIVARHGVKDAEIVLNPDSAMHSVYNIFRGDVPWGSVTVWGAKGKVPKYDHQFYPYREANGTLDDVIWDLEKGSD